jgi:hypothetical protein
MHSMLENEENKMAAELLECSFKPRISKMKESTRESDAYENAQH